MGRLELASMQLELEAIAALLGQTELFAQLSSAHLMVIAGATKVVSLDANSVAVRQGEEGDQLWIVSSGKVLVLLEDRALGVEHPVLELGPGQSFGEMSLLLASARSATVRTLTPCIFVVLAKASFDSILEKLPAVAVGLSRYLSGRLHQQCQLTGFPFVGAEELTYDEELYKSLDPNILRRHHAIPLRIEKDALVVAMTRPNDPAALAALRRELPGMGLRPVACASDDYQAFLDRYLSAPPWRAPAEAAGAAASFTLESGDPVRPPFDRLLAMAVENQEGPIIIEVVSQEVQISRMRSGALEPVPHGMNEEDKQALARQFQPLFAQSTAVNDSLTRSIKVDGDLWEVSLTRLRTLRGHRYSLRLRDPKKNFPNLSYLFPSELLRATLESALGGGAGAIVVGGPPNSGRTTTCYALLKAFAGDLPICNAVTIETAPKTSLDYLSQVKAEAGCADLLPIALEQSPALLMVDEPAPDELAPFLRASDEGRVVIATVRGSDPLEQLAQIGEHGNAAHSGVENVRLVLRQQLLRRICRNCREEFSPSSAVLSQLELSQLGDRHDHFYRGAGCAMCRGSGHDGRLAVYEVLSLTPLLAEMIIKARSPDSVRRAAQSQGLFHPAKAFARLLISQGQLSVSEGLRFFGGSSGAPIGVARQA